MTAAFSVSPTQVRSGSGAANFDWVNPAGYGTTTWEVRPLTEHTGTTTAAATTTTPGAQ